MVYTANGTWTFGVALSPQFGFGSSLGKFAVSTADAIIDPNNGHVRLSDSWTAIANFLHYWSPTWRSNFFGGVFRAEYPTVLRPAAVAFPIAGVPGSVSGLNRDYTLYNVGANLIWSPVSGLDIGVEVM